MNAEEDVKEDAAEIGGEIGAYSSATTAALDLDPNSTQTEIDFHSADNEGRATAEWNPGREAEEEEEAAAGIWPRDVVRRRSSVSSTGSVGLDDHTKPDRPSLYSIGVQSFTPIEKGQELMTASPQYEEILQFFSGNPSVQQFKGEIRICRNEPEGSLCKERHTQLCVLAVPIFMTIADFFRFIGPCVDNIQHMRIVHDESRARYIVLMDLDSQQSADAMYAEFNGKPYSSMDTERCIVMFIKDVQFLDDGAAAKGGRPPLGEPMPRARFPSEAQTELPTCPVCLERLDNSVTGIMTTICNHSFHCRCLSDWPDTSCPVCRYCQQPEEKVACSVCGTAEDLWMCIICGFVGCGRYVDAHALEHYRDTGHTFSIELLSQRVWDYSGDNYVHRLVANRLDGKLVELPEGHAGGSVAARGGKTAEEDEKMGEAMVASKLDNILFQYNDMLTRTLEAQRVFFEGRLGTMQEQWDEERLEMKKEVDGIRKEKQKEEKKNALISAKLKKAWEDCEFHKQLNQQLTENQQAYQDQLAAAAAKDTQIKELQDQVRDLMFYLEAQKSVEESANSEEIKEGQIMVQAAAAGRRRPRREAR